MDGLFVVLGLVVVPSLVAALVVVLAGRSRRGAGGAEPVDRDAVVRGAVDHLVRLNQEMLAGERRVGAAELDGTRTLIDRDLEEVRSELRALTELIQHLERDRREHTGALSSQLAEAGRTTRALAETTQSLREALSSTNARGQWGERMADDVLRLSGLVEGVNYVRHRKLAGSGQVPDYTFLLPDGLVLHMDVKFPLNNYLRFLDATDDVERERCRREFLKDVRLRLREVVARDYVDPAAGTVDCVLLFIPNEAVYAFVQEHDHALFDEALRAKVVCCSPLTLFAVLAVVRQAVDSFRISQASREILARLHGFDQQWGKFVEQMDKTGRSLRSAAQSFEELEGTRRRGVERELDRIAALRREEQLDDLGEGDGGARRQPRCRARRASERRASTRGPDGTRARRLTCAPGRPRGVGCHRRGYPRAVIFVVAALLLLPVVELAVMIQVGSWIGGWEMLALLVMVTFLGVWIVKQQGVGAWSRIRRELAEGRVPGPTIVDGALILAAGVLFVIPGFVTDVAVVLLLLPPARSVCRVALSRRFSVVAAVHTAGGPADGTPSGATPGARGGAYDVESRVRPPNPPSPPPELEP